MAEATSASGYAILRPVDGAYTVNVASFPLPLKEKEGPCATLTTVGFSRQPVKISRNEAAVITRIAFWHLIHILPAPLPLEHRNLRDPRGRTLDYARQHGIHLACSSCCTACT